MSIAAVKLFHVRLLEDVSLQEEIIEHTYATGTGEMWVPMAQKYGFDITAAEADQYLESLQDDEYELSDFELELVAAGTPGGGSGCGGDGGG